MTMLNRRNALTAVVTLGARCKLAETGRAGPPLLPLMLSHGCHDMHCQLVASGMSAATSPAPGENRHFMPPPFQILHPPHHRLSTASLSVRIASLFSLFSFAIFLRLDQINANRNQRASMRSSHQNDFRLTRLTNLQPGGPIKTASKISIRSEGAAGSY
jgi:hypothetical protein